MSKTLIVIILDESYSMEKYKSETIEGFNSFISDQNKLKNHSARYELVKFNTRILPREEYPDIPKLTEKNYIPDGCTALYDATYFGVDFAELNQKEDENVIVIIITDGEENSSKNFTKIQVKEKINKLKNEPLWKFFYIGVEYEKWSEDTGMDRDDCTHYDGSGSKKMYNTLSSNVTSSRGLMKDKRAKMIGGKFNTIPTQIKKSQPSDDSGANKSFDNKVSTLVIPDCAEKADDRKPEYTDEDFNLPPMIAKEFDYEAGKIPPMGNNNSTRFSLFFKNKKEFKEIGSVGIRIRKAQISAFNKGYQHALNDTKMMVERNGGLPCLLPNGMMLVAGPEILPKKEKNPLNFDSACGCQMRPHQILVHSCDTYRNLKFCSTEDEKEKEVNVKPDLLKIEDSADVTGGILLPDGEIRPPTPFPPEQKFTWDDLPEHKVEKAQFST